nr:hypothetical protein [uncultured Chryseobacterium sp.]
MKKLQKLFRNDLKMINGGKILPGNGTGCKECKTCPNGLHSCVTMPTCDEAVKLLNNLC